MKKVWTILSTDELADDDVWIVGSSSRVRAVRQQLKWLGMPSQQLHDERLTM
ncbi:hypothetical protein [Limosilactobacillus caecicola]|uniref:hypothetical protein n=1 Tax=Limosilactobacillus caecicola TaxID=2941332 RepID=UPI0020400756|nr:hypothetical protein [Limosilactobacillus caecicola]